MIRTINRCDVSPVEISIVDEDALSEVLLGCVDSVIRRIHQIGAVVRARCSPSERCFATRIDFAVEDISDRVAGFLSWKSSPDDGRHVGVLIPCVHEHRTGGVYHHDCVVTLACNVLNDGFAVVPECEIVAITFIAVYNDVALARIGVGKHQADATDIVSSSSECCDLRVGIVVRNRLDTATVAADFRFDGLQRCDDIREVCGS